MMTGTLDYRCDDRFPSVPIHPVTLMSRVAGWLERMKEQTADSGSHLVQDHSSWFNDVILDSDFFFSKRFPPVEGWFSIQRHDYYCHRRHRWWCLLWWLVLKTCWFECSLNRCLWSMLRIRMRRWSAIVIANQLRDMDTNAMGWWATAIWSSCVSVWLTPWLSTTNWMLVISYIYSFLSAVDCISESGSEMKERDTGLKSSSSTTHRKRDDDESLFGSRWQRLNVKNPWRWRQD